MHLSKGDSLTNGAISPNSSITAAQVEANVAASMTSFADMMETVMLMPYRRPIASSILI